MAAGGREIVYAGASACRRLGVAGPGDLAGRWPRLLAGAVGAALERAGAAPGTVDSAADGLAPGITLAARPIEGPPRDGYVVVVSEASAAPGVAFDRAGSKMRVIARLYGSATHDLFGPINAIAVNVELLRQSMAADGDEPRAEKRRRWLTNVTEDVFRLSKSLRTVLEFAGLPAPARGRVDLGEVVEFAATLLRPRAKHQNVAVESAPPARAVVVRADADLVRHTALLLGLDALEAMPRGGTLAIAATESGDRARLAIRDGAAPPGAPTPAPRASAAAEPAPPGESLAAARAIAAALGGDVVIEPSCRALSLPLDGVSEPELISKT